MISQFSLYDIVANIVPGALVVGILYLFNSMIGSKLILPNALNTDVSSVTLFLIVSYALGTVAQAIGEVIEPYLIRKHWPDCDPTVRLLCCPNDYFSDNVRNKLNQYINQIFSLTLYWQPLSDTEEQRKEAWEALALCYSLIIKESAAYRAERMKAALRLFRGTFVALIIEIVVLFLVAIYEAVKITFAQGVKHLSLDPLWLGNLILLFSLLWTIVVASWLLFIKLIQLFPVTAFEDFFSLYGLKLAEGSFKDSSAPPVLLKGQ